MTSAEVVICNIDGALFREQRLVLGAIIKSGVLSEVVLQPLRGLENLLDEIADCAHNDYGVDCLLTEPELKEPPKKNWDVYVTRITHSIKPFTVCANEEWAAREIALDSAKKVDWSDTSQTPEFDIESIEESMGHL